MKFCSYYHSDTAQNVFRLLYLTKFMSLSCEDWEAEKDIKKSDNQTVKGVMLV